ncbi:MAG TPA: GNAT family N-acetyltransferase [Blastocatellia bacterium]|jgi:ribosomal protein S18 acetylase RimI-like enzyme|nr:GNAT family N-acetyltransferase [Blastocatellia bacterium]
MDVVLRPATPDDEPFLFELYRWAHSEELPVGHLEADQQELLFRMQFFAQQQTYGAQFPQSEDNIILLDGRPVGRFLVERTANEFRGIDLALLPEYRGRGIGTLILKDVLAEAEATGKPFRFHVAKTNRAAHLYERLGMYKTGESGMHFSMEWDPDK